MDVPQRTLPDKIQQRLNGVNLNSCCFLLPERDWSEKNEGVAQEGHHVIEEISSTILGSADGVSLNKWRVKSGGNVSTFVLRKGKVRQVTDAWGGEKETEGELFRGQRQRNEGEGARSTNTH